jgi:hypothetical protein
MLQTSISEISDIDFRANLRREGLSDELKKKNNFLPKVENGRKIKHKKN